MFNDLRYAFRQLAKNPGFAAIVILTIALGIGANTAIFSLLNQVLLKALPIRDPERVVLVHWKGWSKARRNPTTTKASFPFQFIEGSEIGMKCSTESSPELLRR